MKIPEDVGIQKQLTEMHVREWLQEDLLQLRWWLLIAVMLIFIVLWLILVKKDQLLKICLYAALASIVFLGINEYGEELALWDYPTDIIAIFPPLSSINMFMLPLLFSLIYQYFAGRKSFMIAALIASAVMSLVIDPILTACKLYELVQWKYYESIPVYFVSAVTVRGAVEKISRILEKHKTNQKQSM